MPVVQEPTRVTNTLGKPRDGMSRHVFVGGNFFMQRVLNRYRADLGVWALPEEFEAAATRTTEHLKSKTALISIDRVDVSLRKTGRGPVPQLSAIQQQDGS